LPSTPTFRLSAHAERVIAERRISRAWIERVLSSPARVEPDPFDPCLSHALAPIFERDGRVLRIVYNHEEKPRLVVTAFFDRRERRGRS
jgi:hypothetical protein